MRFIQSIIIPLFIIFLPTSLSSSAQTLQACPFLIQNAYQQFGNSCANQGHNQVCYGNPSVQANFTNPQQNVFFTQQGIRTPVNSLETIETSVLNIADNQWGLTVMNLLVDYPVETRSKGIVMVTLGGVRLENNVPADVALELQDAILRLPLQSDASIINHPPIFSGRVNVIDLITPEATPFLEVDAIESTGGWVRILYAYVTRTGIHPTAWISTEAFDLNTDFSTLPIIDDDTFAPMQSLTLFNNGSPSNCAEAPALILLQTPNQVEGDLVINGVSFRLNGTILFEIINTRDGQSHLRVSVLAGIIQINPETRDILIVPAGYTSQVCLTNGDENICQWTDPQLARNLTQSLEQIPANLMNMPVFVPNIDCASGIGQPICELTFDNPTVALPIVRNLCLDNTLSTEICQTIFPET